MTDPSLRAILPIETERVSSGPSVWHRVWSDRRGRVAAGIIVLLLLLAVLAPLIAPYHPSAQPDILGLQSRPPSLAHPLGTDVFSRDVLSRLLYGARVSLAVGVLAMLVAVVAGTTWGAIAGFIGGPLDALMMRIVDAMMAVPRVLLVLVIVVLWERVPLLSLIAILGLTGWFGLSRLVRAEVRSVAQREFVVSARALGVGRMRLLARHILPNVVSPIVVAATLGVGNVILLEAALSYVGVGVQPPQPSWGNIIQDSTGRFIELWWLSIFPGLAIVTTVIAFNTLGDALRDALDPRDARRAAMRSAPSGAVASTSST